MKDAGVPDFKALLTEAIGVIEGLARHQLSEEWYEEPLARFREAINTPAPYGSLPVGPGWRLINADCIEVDGVSYVFHWEGSEKGHVSRDLVGGVKISARGRDTQGIADAIRQALADEAQPTA